MSTPDAGGRTQTHSVIPIDSLPMWMVTIHEGKVAEHVRPKLKRYQLEARDALARHFFGDLNPRADGRDFRFVTLDLLSDLIRQ